MSRYLVQLHTADDVAVERFDTGIKDELLGEWRTTPVIHSAKRYSYENARERCKVLSTGTGENWCVVPAPQEAA